MSTVTAPRAVNTSDLKFSKIHEPSDLLAFEIEPRQLDWFVPMPDIADEITAHPDRRAFAIEAEGERVGFFVVRRDLRDPRCWWLCYFLLDRRQQGKGYGRNALRLILAYLSKREGCRRIRLQVTPGNDTARGLYERAGFDDTGLLASDGDTILELSLDTGDAIVWMSDPRIAGHEWGVAVLRLTDEGREGRRPAGYRSPGALSGIGQAGGQAGHAFGAGPPH
jgi:Acetyltransferases